jgi:L-alanine-DL-glutamate epimerase-like enolase superfamily enzyme
VPLTSSSLHIEKISLYALRIPLIEPFITSLGRDDDALNVVVRIQTREGLIGFGECSPYMPINGESQETCMAIGRYFGQALLGRNALDIDGCLQLLDTIVYANNSIKSAFDIALHDLASQAAGVPLWKWLQGDNAKRITTDYTVSIGDPDKMAQDAKKILDQGYPAIKVKLGKNGKTDVIRMQAIRKAVGPSVPLRIDANQGWTVPEAIETLQALAPLNIEHCEEPISRYLYTSLPQVKKESPIAIMADECCGDHHDAARLIDLDACDYFNIKLGKAGGIRNGVRIVRLAEAAGIKLQVGAMIESRLAMTAFAHFACCSPQIVHYDFDTALMFRQDPVSGGIRYEKNGVIQLPEGNGLGATIAEEWLEKMEAIHLS